jgi:uncharacterized protein
MHRVLNVAAAMAITATVAKTLPVTTSDVLVIGAGPAGLSVALEAGRRGARIVVVDVSSVFGGHTVLSEGGLSLVGTPLQHSKGIVDTPELAISDFTEWGEDADAAWVRTYVRRSLPDVHDWLTSMGLRFTALRSPAGNSVARFHENPERGFGVVKPLYRECLQLEAIAFHWNTQVTQLLVKNGQVIGARGRRLRSGDEIEFKAKTVVIATGGFQNNEQLVRRYWPAGEPPARILLGSGAQSTGSGLALATRAGAALGRMDHQWNYTWGFPDPRDSSGTRGVFIRIMSAIWVNRNGERFTDEIASARLQMADISRQPDGRYWAVFDDAGKASAVTAGTDWADRSRVERMIFGNQLVVSASSVAELAHRMGVPEEKLATTINRYNGHVDKGKDLDHKRFGFGRTRMQLPFPPKPQKIEGILFYAMPMFVLTRKSLGGIRIDEFCRVLNERNQVIPGLYAAGEVTGFGGLNGRAGLEGTFIGPSILQGRIIGQSVVPSPTRTPPAVRVSSQNEEHRSVDSGESRKCAACHNLRVQLVKRRPGYWHFEQVHAAVLDRSLECTACHAELAPFRARSHKIDPIAQISTCATCHVGPGRQ